MLANLYPSLLLAQAQARARGRTGRRSVRLTADADHHPSGLVLFYFLFIRPQKKKEQEIRDMVHNVKENDRVLTIGGIHGVVTNVQRDAERVTIRVDESTGTKLRINMTAIARVVTAEDQDGEGTSGNKK